MSFPSIESILLKQAVILIKGKRGSGKTALGFHILELQSKKENLLPIVFGIPEEKANLLPARFVLINDLDQIQPDSVVLIDEAGLRFYAKEHQLEEHILINQIIDYSRQNNMTLIFITHHTRKLDINIVTDIDVLIMKRPSLLHSKFERLEMRTLTRLSEIFFNDLDKSIDERGVSYVITDHYEGGVTNPLPDFWNEDISTIYGSEILEIEREIDYQSPINVKVPKKFTELPILTVRNQEYILHLCIADSDKDSHAKCADVLLVKGERLVQFYYLRSGHIPNIILKGRDLINIEEKITLFGTVIL